MRPEVKGSVHVKGIEAPDGRGAIYTVSVANMAANAQMLELMRNGAAMLQLDSNAPEDWPRGFLVFDTEMTTPDMKSGESNTLLQEGVAASLVKLAYMMAIEEHYARKDREQREAS